MRGATRSHGSTGGWVCPHAAAAAVEAHRADRHTANVAWHRLALGTGVGLEWDGPVCKLGCCEQVDLAGSMAGYRLAGSVAGCRLAAHARGGPPAQEWVCRLGGRAGGRGAQAGLRAALRLARTMLMLFPTLHVVFVRHACWAVSHWPLLLLLLHAQQAS